MKRLITIFLLVLALTHPAYAKKDLAFSADSEIGKWRSFVGVEGGAGVFTLSSAFALSINSLVLPIKSSKGLGYSGGVLGGWQKYTSEKIAVRQTLGFRLSYVPNLSSISNDPYPELCILFCKNQTYDFSGSSGQVYIGYYAAEALIDFVKRGKNRFGMSIGGALDLSVSAGMKARIVETGEAKNWEAFLIAIVFRTGFYAQVGHSVFELGFLLPLAGVGAGYPPYPNIATLGYKYLF